MSTEPSTAHLDTMVVVLAEITREVIKEDHEHGHELHLRDGIGASGLALTDHQPGASPDWTWRSVLSFYRMQNDDVPTMLDWGSILMEEVAEVMCAKDEGNLVEELIQVAAVATRWARALVEREGSSLAIATGGPGHGHADPSGD